MSTQRELRIRKFPLLERVERAKQKEESINNEKLFLLKLEKGKGEPSTPLIKQKEIFTRLRLLDNKRRYR